MARSLDKLIRFLLDEIALSGQQGSTPADILGFVSHFYKATNQDASLLENDSEHDRRWNSPTIDRAFQEQVWRWLSKHPDVLIGTDREGNKMSLSAVEAQYLQAPPTASPDTTKDTADSRALLDLNIQQRPRSSSGLRAKVVDALRVYVNEERMWLAICGHSKDLTKVFDTEFALLSIIAAHREVGILQGDLVKESGQDKRSVPKRTDQLQKKGYIEKRVVHLKGLKTSRLVLRRFASNTVNDLITSMPLSVGPRGIMLDESLDFHVLIRNLFTLLKEKQIITRDDLKKELDMTTQWRARVLSRAVRKLEAIGCLKRVKAASELSKEVRYYFPCIKLIREPSERDLDAFHTSGASLADEHAFEEPDLEDEDDAGQSVVEQLSSAGKNRLEEVDRLVPQWNPDRPLTNTLFELVHQAGVQGFTNRQIRLHIFGAFVRRPLEYLLTRLTALWLQSQPPHLRHLAIVRDTTLSGTIPLYVQYSFPNFEARVGSGQAFWEAVRPAGVGAEKKGKKKSSNNIFVSSTDPKLDEYGFPGNYTPSSQYKGAKATLGQCLLAGQPGDLPFSSRDPVLHRDAFGAYVVDYDAGETSTSLLMVRPVRPEDSIIGSANASSNPTIIAKKPPRQRKPGATPKGRPRKFLQGTEKFWQGQFAKAKKLADVDTYSLSTPKTGVMSDPAGLSLFAKRPQQFDQTLVLALEDGLPVPAKPKDITQQWVDKMLPVLNRSVPGAYITPKGTKLQGFRGPKSASRILIFRTSRLGELDLSMGKKVPVVRFLVSSAAHTFADIRNEFLDEIIDDSENDTFASSSSRIQRHSPAIDSELDTSQRQWVQQGQVHSTSPIIERDRTPETQEAESVAPFSEAPRRVRRTKNAKTGSFRKASTLERDQFSQFSERADIFKSLDSPTRPFGLPSPLTTRSLLRKDTVSEQATPATKDVYKSPAASASHENNDHVGIVLQAPTTDIRAGDSAHLDKIPIVNYLSGIKPPSATQSTHGDPCRESGLAEAANRAGTEKAVLDAFAKEQDHLKSSLQSARLTGVELQGAVIGAATALGGRESSGIGHSHSTSFDVGERESEAFRLVQELTANEMEQNHRADETTLNNDDQQTQSHTDSPRPNELTTLPEMRISDNDTDQEPTRKRSRQGGVGGGSVTLLRRKIMLDLMEASDGALPYYPNALLNAFTTAWRKASQSGKPDLRTIKAVVKSLCQNGSAKQIKFSHRNKKGIMTTKSILAKPHMAVSDPVVLGIQKNMIEVDPRPYLHKALDTDSKVKGDLEKPASRPWPPVLEEQTVEPSVTPAIVLRLQLRETLSRARIKQRTADPETPDIDEAHDLRGGDAGPQTRLASIRRKYATSSEPYQRPKLSTLNYSQPPQQAFSNQRKETPRSLQFRTELPLARLTFEALASNTHPSLESQIPTASRRNEHASSASQVSSSHSTPKGQQVQPVNIVWKKLGDRPVLPSSLEDILLDVRRKRKSNHAKDYDPNYREFEWKVDGVARWEQRSLKLFNSKSANYVFIHHPVGNSFQAAPRSRSRITFDGLIWYDNRGREHTEKRFHEFDEEILGLPTDEGYSDFLREAETVIAQAPGKRRRYSTERPETARKRRRGNPPVTQPQTITDSAGNLIDVSHLIGAKYKRSRGTQHLRTMPERLIYKLIVTVVVVRALAGGLEKHVDWPLVKFVFPDENEQFLKDRWKTLSNKHRHEIQQLTENFQDRFPEAYAKGQVPQVNFDSPESTDWEGVMKWALNSLDKPIMHEIQDLPATRSEFGETVNMTIGNSSRPYRDLFGYNQAVTVPMKEAAICAIPLAVPLLLVPSADSSHPPHLHDTTDDKNDPSLTLAKSWALSTITMPLQTFDPAVAHSKLQGVASTARKSESLIESAMKSLISSRAISKKRDKNTDARGRSFELSRIFTDTLDQRRTVNATMLKQAVHYKTTVLDAAFERGEAVKFDPVITEDGEMITILNLAATGRIQIRIGDDVPRNRWGIDPKSKYQTRNIKKESLYFTVLIVPVRRRYVFGDVLLAERDIPIPTLGTGDRDRIPIWRDIHGGFHRNFWDLALAAVLGILASRPGDNVREVAKMMSPTLAEWEVECLLGWCLEVGAVKKTKLYEEGGWTGGWEVAEWWWMVLECGKIET